MARTLLRIIPDGEVDPVANLAWQLSTEHGWAAAQLVSQVMSPDMEDHAINQTRFDTALFRADQIGREKFMTERHNGLHNDERSRGIGLRALFLVNPDLVDDSKYWMQTVRRQLEEFTNNDSASEEPRIEHVGGFYDSFEGGDITTHTYGLWLPQGAFDNTGSNRRVMVFHTQARDTVSGILRPDYSSPELRVPVTDVVRVEDSVGGLWQSHVLRPDQEGVTIGWRKLQEPITTEQN